MDNSVMLDYLAVTIKGLAPDDVIEKILILPKDKFVLNEWGINKYQRHYSFSE
ncbi:TPA: replication initiation factor domain-containing protein, partial [Streptococcus agalactiae]